jgi:uncharacterized protein (TIGR03085 family)
MLDRVCQGEEMPSHSAAEREALADELAQAGPHLPTLCDGWTTTELVAHLVSRERRPDAALGLVIPALSSWTDRIQGNYATKPYPDLVAAFRSGPPFGSPMAFPGVDSRVNLVEHFVHREDVRRARPNWTARELPAARQDALWAQIGQMGRMLFRSSPVSVTLRTPDGRSRKVVTRANGEGIDLVGEPAELTLYGCGRKDQAQVQIEGPDDAVTAFRTLSLNL